MNFISILERSIIEKEIEYILDTIKSIWVSLLDKYIDIVADKVCVRSLSKQ